MRLFIAIPLPEEIKKEIFVNVEPLKKLMGSGVFSGKFVEKENLHLTLKFLGDLNEEEQEKIELIENKIYEAINIFKSVKGFNKDFQSFNLRLSDFGGFPNLDFIKVLWVGVKEISQNSENRVLNLQEFIQEKLSEIGFPKENKEFHSHITIARIKSVKNKKEFQSKISELNIPSKSFPVEKICLFKSSLFKEGAKHEVIKEFYL